MTATNFNIYKNFIQPFRIKEIIFMSGFFIIGYVFAVRNFNTVNCELILLSGCIVSYIFSVYALNSYTDYETDKNNPRLQNISRIAEHSFRNITVLSITLALISGYSINKPVFVSIACSFMLWLLYYLKPVQLKATVLGGTIIHFIAGILHFHIGYLAVTHISPNSILISVYFSLLLCMGHLNHELLDYDSDKANNIRNTTVAWGTKNVSLLIKTLFGLSAIFWVILYYCGTIRLMEFLSFFVVQSLITLVSLSRGKFESPRIFQFYYRLLFIAGGLLLIISRLL